MGLDELNLNVSPYIDELLEKTERNLVGKESSLAVDYQNLMQKYLEEQERSKALEAAFIQAKALANAQYQQLESAAAQHEADQGQLRKQAELIKDLTAKLQTAEKNNAVLQARLETMRQLRPDLPAGIFQNPSSSPVSTTPRAGEREVRLNGLSERLADVCGMEQLKLQIQRRLIEHCRRCGSVSDSRPDPAPARGVCFYGPSGCGMLFIARAAIGEMQWPCLQIDANDFRNRNDAEVRDWFLPLRNTPDATVLIHDMEQLFCCRNEVSERFVRELENIKRAGGNILLAGTTDAPDRIDDAFLQAGWFNTFFRVDAPDFPARNGILTRTFRSMNFAVDEEALIHLAGATEGFSAAELVTLARRIEQSAATMKLDRGNISLIRESLRGVSTSPATAEAAKRIAEWEKNHRINSL